jgi:hypothetical protein
MVIKSQQDIKNENKAKSDKIPKGMENKQVIARKSDTQASDAQKATPPTPKPDINERVTAIESYLVKVDGAFITISEELGNIKTLVKLIQDMDVEISKLTGDIVRLTKINEERYIELATEANSANEKIETLDKYIPVFVDNKIKSYFEELSQDEPQQEDTQQGDVSKSE